MSDDDRELSARVTTLEAQVEQLLRRSPGADASAVPESRASASGASAAGGPRSVSLGDQEMFWSLTALKERYAAPGAVSFTGSVDLGIGHVEYQWDRPTPAITQMDWSDSADRIAALGHPLRLTILRTLLQGQHTVAELVDQLHLGSTGVAYHHLNQLQNAGWVHSPERGTWALNVSRVVPLLTVIIACEDV